VNPYVADAELLGRRTWASPFSDARVLRDGVVLEDGARLLERGGSGLGFRALLRGLFPGDFALGAVASGEAQEAAARVAALTMATDADRLSTCDFARLEDGEDRMVEGGFGQLVADVAAGVSVHTDHAVEQIDWRRAERITLSGAFGSVRARRVLITVPPPVLAAGGIRFDPPLPVEKQEALAALPGGRFVKVGLRLDAALTEFPEFAHDVGLAARGETFVIHADRRQPLATVILAGRHAEAVSREGADALAAAGRASLVACFGADAGRRVQGATATDWSAEPFSRGPYTTVVLGSRHARARYAETLEERLFFAGDSAPSPWAITVAGARRSGEAAAREILESAA
jgi:monoamine oxidase